MRTTPVTMALALAALLPLSVASQQTVTPSKGQSAAQQQADETECSNTAIQQSGYNPANPPAAATAQTAPVTGSGTRARGAAAGAAVGAVGGNDVGNAAAKGAVVGGVAQRNRNRKAASDQNQASAQQQQAGASAYWNARQTCLTGRGYSVQ